MLLCGCYVYYIEFGFELVKMIELMKVVSGGGLNYLCYMVVDINELLEDVMWYVIMLFLKMLGCFNYIVDDYWNVQWNYIDLGQDVMFIMMFGFQEGNELLVMIGWLICNFGGKLIYVVLEMQLFVEGCEEFIYNFYQNENMVWFFEIVSWQQGFELFGKYYVLIVWFNLFGDQFYVVVMLQLVLKVGVDGYLIINVCLKYMLE